MSYDFIVIGAGVVGLSAAYHLKRMSPGSSVLAVDARGGPGMGDTSRAVGGFRSAFTSPINASLARSSISFYRDLQSSGRDLGLREVGYLFLATAGEEDMFREALGPGARFLGPDELAGLGVRAEVSGLEDAELMGLEDLAGGFLYREAGILDPTSIVEFYAGAFSDAGGEFLYGSRADVVLEPLRPIGIPGEPLPWQEVRARGIVVGGREVVRARGIVVAAGAWTQGMLSGLGLALPLMPLKRHVFAVPAEGEGLRSLLRGGTMPAVVMPRGVFVRPEPGGAFYVELSGRQPYGLEDEPEPEPGMWELWGLPVLRSYMPAFEGAAPTSSWAGFYDMNVAERRPVVQRLVEGLVAVAGTSGSGIMKADALGRFAASAALGLEEVELYGGGRMRTDALAIEGREGLVI